MQLNVLLVDDEYIVLKGLEIILKEQCEVDLKVVTAMDASDALEKLDTFCPDVVITDINMPETNGFEMIEQIQTLFPLCHFIICSGYEDYDYLKQALRLHIADYLLKPIDKSLLLHRLGKLAAEKEKWISHVLLRIQILLLKGACDAEMNFHEEEFAHVFPYHSFCLCAVNTVSSHSEEFQKQLSQYFDTIYLFTLNAQTVYLLNYPEKIRPKEVISILSSIVQDTSWGCSFFTSDPETSEAVRLIPLRYQEALSDMVLSLLPISQKDKDDVCKLSVTRTLFPAIRVITFEDNIEDYIQELFENTPRELCYPLVFTEIVSAYILISNISLSSDLIRQLYQSQSDSSCSKKNLGQFIKKILNFWYDSFSQTEQTNCSSKIASACQYIDTHYQEDLSLEQIAEMLSMNSSYLSYIFKKETGSTLVQYLTNTRMQHACHLLQANPELSLDEIAVCVGYHSTTYFHKIFRGRFGVSPRQWQLTHTQDTKK